jgi:hypothetical protein
MTINRGAMGRQLKGNKMKCGPSKMKKGGPVKATGMKAGGKVTRGDGACMKGHTKGKMR